MKAEEDTRDIPSAEPGHSQDDLPTSNLGPWGMDAVPLSREERERKPVEGPRPAETKSHRRVALAAIVCATGLLVALGVNVLSGGSPLQTEKAESGQAKGRPLADEPGSNGGRAERRIEQRQQQARPKSRQRSIPPTRRTHPAPSPTYAPAPEPTPAPEPVAPSPAPAPAPAPSPTTKPPAASGPIVAKEFGFER